MEDYLSRICQKTEEVPLWPNFNTIFKGTLSRSIQGAGINSIRIMKPNRNMQVWPTIDKEKAGGTEIVEEDDKEDIKPSYILSTQGNS